MYLGDNLFTALLPRRSFFLKKTVLLCSPVILMKTLLKFGIIHPLRRCHFVTHFFSGCKKTQPSLASYSRVFRQLNETVCPRTCLFFPSSSRRYACDSVWIRDVRTFSSIHSIFADRFTKYAFLLVFYSDLRSRQNCCRVTGETTKSSRLYSPQQQEQRH